MNSILTKKLTKSVPADSLAFFRIAFGLLMGGSLIRFISRGWITEFYATPSFFFHYYGFSWVTPLPEPYLSLVFYIATLSTVAITLGFYYRFFAIVFFLSFGYTELLDVTYYLNHYYFISLLSFLMIFLPAAKSFSIDSLRNKEKGYEIPFWTIAYVRILLGMVYFFAGVAKLHSDWLIEAQPLKIWLKNSMYIPIIGPLLQGDHIALLMSWSGCIYDLTIPFILCFRKTRIWGYLAVVFFHILTRILFPIGVFPYVMIISTLIFFPTKWHHEVINKLRFLFNGQTTPLPSIASKPYTFNLVAIGLGFFLLIQTILPFRYLLYPGALFWTEQGFRFSWRVMLMEKNGTATFYIHSKDAPPKAVLNSDFLTPYQEKMMATQPDFILQYAHHLKQHAIEKGLKEVKITAEIYVSLNGRRSKLFIDPNVDLGAIEDSFEHKDWILPFSE